MGDRRPDQWFTNQPGQRDFLASKAPWAAYVGGWGSGKTFIGARKLLLLHQLNQCPGMAVAPTYGDLWRVVVPQLAEACASVRWPCRVVKSEPRHLMVGQYPIWLLSGDTPERFAGFEIGHGWIDEAARIATSDDPLKDSPTQIRSRFRHPSAKRIQGLITTTHEGTSSWVYRDWVGKPKAGHDAFRGRTALNRALPPEYLADRLATLPAGLAEQYLEGEAVDYTAKRAHPGFGQRHQAVVEIDPRYPLHIGMDFNVSPLCWVLGQVVPDPGGDRMKARVHILDELVVEDHASISGAMVRANEKGWGKATVHIHPDRSSNNRSTTGNPIATELGDIARALQWRYVLRNDGGNPAVAARIMLVDALVDPFQGSPRLTVHPKCVRLIKELNSVGRTHSGHYDPGRDGQFGHILDALGYLVWDELRPGSGFANGFTQ
jgi:hypothetical protein